MTRNDAVAMQLFCVLMTFSDALPVLSTKNDGHCHHSRMGVFPDYNRLARETSVYVVGPAPTRFGVVVGVGQLLCHQKW